MISISNHRITGGETRHAAHLEDARDRWRWVRWSYVWEVQKPGNYSITSRATDEVGRVQSRKARYNNMLKSFSAIVGNEVTVN